MEHHFDTIIRFKENTVKLLLATIYSSHNIYYSIVCDVEFFNQMDVVDYREMYKIHVSNLRQKMLFGFDENIMSLG